MDPRFQGAGITQPEFEQKIQAANAVLKKDKKWWVVVAFIVFIVLMPNIGFRLAVSADCEDVEPVIEERETTSVDSKLCGVGYRRKANSTLVWPKRRNDRRNCGDADEYVNSYCSKRKNKECYEHIIGMCCEPHHEEDHDKSEDHNKKCGRGALLFILVAAATFFSVAGFIAYICHVKKVVRQKIHALFQEWQPRGISVQKIDSSKHQRGALCFIFSATNVLAPIIVYQQQAPVMGIVQQPPGQQAPVMGIVQQPPGQVQMGVVQPMVPQLSYGEPVRPVQPIQPIQPLQQQGVVHQATPIVVQPKP